METEKEVVSTEEGTSTAESTLTIKDKAIMLYILFGLAYAIYAWMWGDTSEKSFAYNIGQGIVWPFVVFPALGKIVGGVVLVVFVILISI